jgi:ferric-dicitrate binding protein FerR (iron transport regulator)
MTDGDIDWVALDRYVGGEGTPDEREMMRRRIRASPTLTAIVDVMRSAGHASPEENSPADTDRAWGALSARLGSDRRHEPLALISPEPPSRGLSRLRGWAAAALFIAGSAYASWRALRPSPSIRAQAPAIRATYATARGERATVELRDGTRVTLAPGTEIRVTAVGRQIYLSGEAVFSVTHDPTQPFRVTAPSGTTIEDIGTQFDVRAYDKTVRVVVADGSVSIEGAKPVILARGALGVVDSTGATRVTQGVAVDRYLAWSQGNLTFVNAPMREVIPELDRWYDIDVHLGSAKLADDRLTVTISDIPADVALDVIARALDASVVRSGQTVTLVSRR